MNGTEALGKEAIIKSSGERGTVIGHASYLHSEPAYLVRYRAADGRAVEQWWGESAVEVVAS
jgi:hypothetical protein